MLGELSQLSRVHEYEKTYWVMIEGDATQEKLTQLERGVQLKEYVSLPCKARLIPTPEPATATQACDTSGPTAWIEIKLREGKKRQIRHMTASDGLFALRLVRVAIGRIWLGDLGVGEWRELTRQELALLK